MRLATRPSSARSRWVEWRSRWVECRSRSVECKSRVVEDSKKYRSFGHDTGLFCYAALMLWCCDTLILPPTCDRGTIGLFCYDTGLFCSDTPANLRQRDYRSLSLRDQHYTQRDLRQRHVIPPGKRARQEEARARQLVLYLACLQACVPVV